MANKVSKSEIVPGLLLASARWSDVLVVGWWKQSRGLVKCRVWASDGEREVVLPYQSLRWQ